MLMFIAHRVNSMQFMCIASHTCLFCDFPIVYYHQVFFPQKNESGWGDCKPEFTWGTIKKI